MKITSIENCLEYVFLNGRLYSIDVDKNFCIDEHVVLKGDFSIRGKTDTSIWLFDQDNFETHVYSDLIRVHHIKEYGVVLNHYLGNHQYVVGLNSGEKITKGIFNVQTLKLEREVSTLGLKGVYLMINDNLFVTRDKHNLGLFNLNNEVIWKYKLVDFTGSEGRANLHSQILNGDDKLFFVVTGNERKGLFALDIETGEVLKKFDGLCYEIFKGGNYIYTTQFENILCRINTKTLELETWDCNVLVTENGFHSIHDHRCDVVNGRFCFTQTIGDNKAKLGILDWENKELVYKYDFEPENGAIGSIQVSETRMFVHTQDNTLHIFEKE